MSQAVTTEDSITRPVTSGLTITVAGFLFKIAAASFHNWALEVYDGTPITVTTWRRIMLKTYQNRKQVSDVTVTLSSTTEGFSVWRKLRSNPMNALSKHWYSVRISIESSDHDYSTISYVVSFFQHQLSTDTEGSIGLFISYLLGYSVTNLNAFLTLQALGHVISQAWANSKGTNIRFTSQFRTIPIKPFTRSFTSKHVQSKMLVFHL